MGLTFPGRPQPARGLTMSARRQPGVAALPPGVPRRLPVVAALVGVLALAGCGATQKTPLQAVITAAKTTLAQTAESNTTLTHATAFGGGPTAVAARAAFAFPRGIGYEQLDLPASGNEPAAPGYLTFTPTTAYFLPRPTGALPKGKTWVSIPLGGSALVRAKFPRLIEQLEGLSPQLLLSELATGSTAASSSGARVVNHVPLTEYVVSVDLRRVLAAAKGPSAAAIHAAVERELAALGSNSSAGRPASVRLTALVNGPGLVTAVTGPIPGSGLGTEAVSFSSFAVKLPTSPPPSALVTSVTALPSAAQAPFAPWAAQPAS